MSRSNRPGPRRWGDGLEPIPETRLAINELEPSDDIDNLLLDLLDQGRRVRDLVPDCVALSLATLAQGVTMTLVASDRDIAILDALQHLDPDPSADPVAAPRVASPEAHEPGTMTEWESRWQHTAENTSALGVRSTLTIPIMVEDAVVGSISLYAATPRAFVGLHPQVAEIFRAWAPGAVSNADLSFTTRDQAREAPRILREAARIDAAVGLLVSTLDIPERDARRRLHDAAVRGGVEVVQLAEALLGLLRRPDVPPGSR